MTFEETYKDYLLDRKVVSSKDFQKAIRFLARDEEDDVGAGSVADELDAVADAKDYIESLPTVDLNEYDLRNLTHDVEADVKLLKGLYERTEILAAKDGKLQRLKELLAGDLKGKKVLIFSTFKDTTRYLHRRLTEDAKWLKLADNPHIRRIDSGNHPDERGHIIAQFEVALVLVGAFTLRTFGALSEKNFLSLVMPAFREQFKAFTFVEGLFSKQKEVRNEEKRKGKNG